MNGNLCRSSCKSVEKDMEIGGNEYGSGGSRWKSVKVYTAVCGSRRRNMEARGSRWESVEVAGCM